MEQKIAIVPIDDFEVSSNISGGVYRVTPVSDVVKKYVKRYYNGVIMKKFIIPFHKFDIMIENLGKITGEAVTVLYN